MLTLGNLLNQKPRAFNFIEPAATVQEALHLLGVVNLSYLVVMDGPRFVGIFCEHDFVKNVALQGGDVKKMLVREVMSTNLPSLQTTDLVPQCMHFFDLREVKYLPVFEKMSFAGVVTRGDVLRFLLKEDSMGGFGVRYEEHNALYTMVF
ncbi:MAG: CBS domain-containing protein [Chitinophagaceae bacterium]|jgi:CBS domain-containing protein|nr:CBS domain-containing protein [Chitinophagaceae bacterium]